MAAKKAEGLEPGALERLGVRIKSQHRPFSEKEMLRAKKKPLLAVDHARKRKRTYITMDPEAISIARKIGNGVISRGVDRALFHFADCRKKTQGET